MNFKGKAKRIEDIDLPLIGREIGVGIGRQIWNAIVGR